MAGMGTVRLVRKRILLAMVFLVLCSVAGAAQAQTGAADEMQTGTGGPAGNGPAVSNQTVTMRINTDNPTTSLAFAAPLVPIDVTYSLSNQQYTGYTTAQGFPAGSGGNAVVFGTRLNSGGNTMQSGPIYLSMNSVGTPSNGQFTSFNAPNGQGIDVAANGAIEIFASTRALALVASPPATNTRVQMADLTITFSRPVNNPILHFVGMGGSVGGLGITGEFDLVTPGATLTRLSGNAQLSVTATQINNSAANPSASCAATEAGCGSVRVNGTQLTSVTLRLYMRGDGQAASWTSNNTHPGDAFAVGVSLDPQSQITLQKTTTNSVGTFNYALTGTNPPGTASLTTAAVNTAVSTPTPIIIPSSFTQVTAVETIPANWLATNVSCTQAGATSSITATTATATIPAASMTPNSNITCSYTNRRFSSDLSITKTDGVTSVVSGGTTTYTIRVTNNTGSDTVTGAILKDPLATGLTKTAVVCSATPGQCTAGTTPTIAQLEDAVNGYALPALAAGQFYEIRVTCTVN